MTFHHEPSPRDWPMTILVSIQIASCVTIVAAWGYLQVFL